LPEEFPDEDFNEEKSDHSSNSPMQQEIEEYARFLGMNPSDPIDQQLMWIAKEGLMEPVPSPWQVL